MTTFLPLFLQQHVATLKDTVNVETRLRLYFTPLRQTRLQDLTRLQILEWFNGIAAHSPAQANHCLSLLRTMYAKAQAWGLYDGENKARFIAKRPKHNRKRYLHPEELARLLTVLKDAPAWVQAYLHLCLTVGSRPGEARVMKWDHLSFFEEHGAWVGRWTKPTTKTTPHSIPLPTALANRLCLLPRLGPYVFPGHCSHAVVSKSQVFAEWRKVRHAAGLPDVHLHDLRRTCATYLADEGANLSVISKGVLNHTNLQTTSIYVQQMQAPVMKALEAHSAVLRRMGGER